MLKKKIIEKNRKYKTNNFNSIFCLKHKSRVNLGQLLSLIASDKSKIYHIIIFKFLCFSSHVHVFNLSI